jgi:hypothetical protein
MLAYKRRGDTVSEADMNQVWFGNNAGNSVPLGGFSGKLYNLLGGKTFLLAFQNDGFNAGVPPQLLGKTFFFNDGKPTAYSQNVPGALTYQVATVDPVTGLAVNGTGVRSYDHSYFATAAGVATVSTDEPNRIRYIADVPQSAYPPGLQKLNAISLFEHSLDTHEEAQGFFLGELQKANGEGGGYFPTKRYEHAVAELIIENLNALNIPAAQDRKFSCVRAHNLSLLACTLTLSGYAVVIPPLGCVTIRRTWDASIKAWKNHWEGHYFFPFRATDITFFWHWPALPSFVNPPARTATAVTCGNGAQGNNVSNPAVLYDFVSALRWSPVTTNCAWLFLDVHEVCDMGADFADYYPALKNTPDFPAEEKGQLRPDAKLFDLLVHAGRCDLKKVRAVAQAEGNLITSATFQYRGLKTILADFAAAGITVTTHADGNLQFSRIEPNFIWDLLPIGTNLFRWSLIVPDQFDNYWQKLPRTIELNIARKLEPRILENGGLTNPFGTTNFTLRTSSDYRIAQRTVTALARPRTYVNAAGQTITVQGAPQNSITLKLGPLKSVAGVHTIGAADYRDSLQYHGDANLTDQSDAHVIYTDQRLVMTPNGLVLTFTERVRADIPSYYTNSQSPTAYAYAPIAGMETSHVRYTFNAALGKFEAKHCVRFRKHGLGFAEFGKQFAHHYTPAVGRCLGPDYTSAQKGSNGADAAIIEQSTELAVKQARSILVDELGYSSARFAIPYAVDGWPAYATGGASNYGEAGFNGFGYFYKQRPNNQVAIGPLAWVPMTAEHINSLLQLVNQCKTGKPLDQSCLIMMAGNRRLKFGDLHWSSFPGPAPKTAYARIDHLGDRLYWKQFLPAHAMPVLTVADLPASFNIHRTVSSEYRTVTQQVSATVSDAAHVGYRFIYESNGFYYWAIFNGRVTMQISDPQFTGPTTFSQGVAVIGDPRYNDLSNAWLNRDYAAVEWIDQTSVRAFVTSLGLTYWRIEPIIPLKLGVWELSAEFEPTPEVDSVKTAVYQGEIASEDTDRHITQPAPTGPPPNAVAQLNGVTQTYTSSWSLGQRWGVDATAIITKQLAFRLADTAAECEWKLLLPSNRPPLSFYAERGRYDFRVATHLGFNLSKSYRTRASVAAVIYPMKSAAPWFPSFYDMSPNPAQNEGSDINHQWLGGSLVQSCDPAGPRLYAQIKRTDLGDEFWAWQNGDRQWHAMDVQTSAGVSLPVTLVPVPAWGVVKDWWKENQDVFLSSLARIATSKPEDMPAGVATLVNCPEGITVLKPGVKTSNMAFYDPQLAIAL